MGRVVSALIALIMAVSVVGAQTGTAGAAVNEAHEGLWELSVTPGVPNWPDPSAGSIGVELGVTFVTSEDTSVVGVRFYKGDLNTGTHLGTLWTEDGVLLTTGTFTNETTSGWQDLVFDDPVSISPGQVYVASYYSPTSNYSAVNDYFDASVTTGPITAIAGVGAEVNGVFRYSDASVYPDMSFRNSNYWVTPLWSDEIDIKSSIVEIAGQLQMLIDQDPGSDLADKLEDVVEKLNTACEELEKIPADVEATAGALEGAVGDLEAAIDDDLFANSTDGVDIVESMVDVARQLAVETIAANQSGDPDKIGDAEEYLAEGDDLRDEGKYKDAAAAYKSAVSSARGA